MFSDGSVLVSANSMCLKTPHHKNKLNIAMSVKHYKNNKKLLIVVTRLEIEVKCGS